MKLIIIGATGTIGQKLVRQALAEGHQVSGFSRHPGAAAIEHPEYTPIAGDVLDSAEVSQAVAGHDAVLIVLGSGRKGTVRSAGTRNVIAAMKVHGIRRLICQSTLGAGDSRENLNFFWKHIMFGLLLREAYADHALQERYVRESGLDWTIVRPGAFTDGPRTGKYRHGFAATDRTTRLKISRADVADFTLKQLRGAEYVRQAPGISY